ncbi:hypothetical protein ATCC90586_005863 [Pythium insidiosum]|nr:hypothetical protein ATCC90586_005863 [Pythium insidiosum]
MRVAPPTQTTRSDLRDASEPTAMSFSTAIVLQVTNCLTQHSTTTAALRATAQGIAVGRGSPAVFQCHADPAVALLHGTFECTARHRVWVFVDHSDSGTTLNGSQRVHQRAVVVHDGDVLTLGNTEIKVTIVPGAKEKPASPAHAASPPMSIVTSAADAARRPSPQTAPEYINSPIPGGAWRKKRHSMTAMTMRTQAPIALAPSTSSSQSFARSTLKTLVPSAPATPPPARGADAPRPASHIVAASPQPTAMRPSSAYFHVKWKEEVEEIPRETTKPPVPPAATLARHHSASSVSSTSPTSPSSSSSARSTPVHAPLDGGMSRSPPPLEYSSSPVTTSSLMERFQRHERPASSAASPGVPASVASSTPRHRETDGAAPLSARPQLDGVAAPAKSRRDDLRIQVSKRMAVFASSKATGQDALAHGAGPAQAPPSSAARAMSIPIPAASAAAPAEAGATTVGGPKTAAATARRALDFTPPTSPVAHQDILRQKQSLLNILKHKYKEEQLLKQQQEEWMRNQLQTLPGNSTGSAPSMSPINLKGGKKSLRGATEDASHRDSSTDDDDDGMRMPERAPALLRTVSLGHPTLRQHQHQPSPRLTAAVLASRARKGSGDGRARTFSTDSTLSADAGHTPTKRSSGRRPQRSSRSPSPSRVDGARRSHRASHDSSVSSSVSTEPTNYRRVTRSLSFSSSRAASSGDWSEFVGYDEDTDELTSFTSPFFGGGPASAERADERKRPTAFASVSESPSPRRRPLTGRSLTSPGGRLLRQRHAPELDDVVAGVSGLLSPSVRHHLAGRPFFRRDLDIDVSHGLS